MGGLAALTLVVAVACSGAADTVDSTVFTPPTTEQVSDNGDSPDIKSTGVTPSSEIESFGSEPSTSTKSSVADDPGDTIEAIFDEYEVSEPTGDALQELVPEVDSPEVAPEVTPEVMISELTFAEIVAAQGDHLADLYEQAVQSIVFIRASTSQAEGSGSGFVWDTDGHVVTNYHVVQGASSLTAKFFNVR